MNGGIDYGLGKTNIDRDNGIRYGVIYLNSLAEYIYDEMEQNYGDPTCPECDGIISDETDSKDFFCLRCEKTLWSDEVYGDEPIGWTLEDGDDITATDCLDNDAMVIKSRYYTYAPYCSPCVPGAGNLDSVDFDPNSDALLGTDGRIHSLLECFTNSELATRLRLIMSVRGVKTYCFGPDWFHADHSNPADNPRYCPYPVWRVEDNGLHYVPATREEHKEMWRESCRQNTES